MGAYPGTFLRKECVMTKDFDYPVLKEAQPGRDILFKRREGRGRPAQGKVISQSSKGITVALANNKLERVKPHLVHKVMVRRGKVPALDPFLLAKARAFEQDAASA